MFVIQDKTLEKKLLIVETLTERLILLSNALTEYSL